MLLQIMRHGYFMNAIDVLCDFTVCLCRHSWPDRDRARSQDLRPLTGAAGFPRVNSDFSAALVDHVDHDEPGFWTAGGFGDFEEPDELAPVFEARYVTALSSVERRG